MTDSIEIRKIWRRFCKNIPALASLIIIFLAFLVSVLAYLVAPDNTPDANTQYPEYALCPPGTRGNFLVFPADTLVRQRFFDKMAHGNKENRRLVPVLPETVSLRGDSVCWLSPGSPAMKGSTHLAAFFFPGADSISVSSDFYHFITHTGARMAVKKEDLSSKFLSEKLIESRLFLLGADKYGRCIYSRILLGFRVSLFVGLLAVFVSLTVGLILGLAGGYFGGRTDDLVMLMVNTVWSVPTLLLVFAVVLALGRGISVIFLAVGLTMWVDVARIVRGQTIAIRAQPFVEAARSMGAGHFRIILYHILPNLVGPVMVVSAGNFATSILVESGLSYLGFGVQPPAPSWGGMLSENYGYAIGGKPLLALAPALAIAIAVLAFNLLGNGLRDALDVKIRNSNH
ncbi:MAG: ABC transporter permease [Bacteroidota bacterium]